jgi:hypothetical protein
VNRAQRVADTHQLASIQWWDDDQATERAEVKGINKYHRVYADPQDRSKSTND